jgi:hypothetical protein
MPTVGQTIRSIKRPGAGYVRQSPGIYKYVGTPGKTPTGTPITPGTPRPKAVPPPPPTVPDFGGTPQPSPFQPRPGQEFKPFDLGNPYGAIQGQQQANEQNVLDQFRANRPTTTVNPYGRQDVGYDPATGAYQVRQDLDPFEQEKLQQNRGRDIFLGRYAGDKLQEFPGTPFSLSGLPAGLDTSQLEAARQSAQDSVTKRFEQVNAPVFQKQTEDLNQRLLSSGIPQGSELWNKEHDRLARQQQDARDAATAQGVQLGGQELQRSFDIGQQGRQSALQEQLTARGLPYDELSRILGLRGDVVNPQFQALSNIDVPQNNIYQGTSGYLGAASDIYRQQVQGKQDLARQSLANRGGGALSLADQIARAQALQDIETRGQIDLRNFDFRNNPAYQSPSTGSQIGSFLGGIGGAFGGAFAQGAGQGLANSIFSSGAPAAPNIVGASFI